MKNKKKLVAILAIAAFVLTGIAASKPPKDGFKNLKVLPKNISNEVMDKVMEEFSKALNVGCDFCHAQDKKDSTLMDMASDARPEKEITRQMITMTNKINKDFFGAKTKYGDKDMILAVNCMTCHRGNPHPDIAAQETEEKKQ